ncbi:hypothetical protein MMC13_007866 [Lambiella insularis]|nr:hypothetical protein [Lambiella insularis]
MADLDHLYKVLLDQLNGLLTTQNHITRNQPLTTVLEDFLVSLELWACDIGVENRALSSAQSNSSLRQNLLLIFEYIEKQLALVQALELGETSSKGKAPEYIPDASVKSFEETFLQISLIDEEFSDQRSTKIPRNEDIWTILLDLENNLSALLEILQYLKDIDANILFVRTVPENILTNTSNFKFWYFQMIKDKFPQAEDWLVNTLTDANLFRHLSLRNQRSPVLSDVSEPVSQGSG